jgi:hypothetical protein
MRHIIGSIAADRTGTFGMQRVKTLALIMTFALALGAPISAVGGPSGPVTLITPLETPGQFSYAFVASGDLATDDGWVAIDFHRDPGCSELAGFNLLVFVDPNALDCPLTVQMKEWWYPQDLVTAGGPWGSLPGESTFRTPVHAQWRGMGAVPVYFVLETEFLEAIEDGVLTVSELESLPSLLIGSATEYQFLQINSGRVNASLTRRPGHTVTVAHGVLEDGRSFQFNLITRDNRITSIGIEFR